MLIDNNIYTIEKMRQEVMLEKKLKIIKLVVFGKSKIYYSVDTFTKTHVPV